MVDRQPNTDGDPPEHISASLLDQAFYEYLHAEDEEDERHKPVVGKYHASDGATCVRARYYQDTNVKEMWPFDKGIGERGNRIEDFALDVLTEYFHDEHPEWGIRVEQDLPVSVDIDDFRVTGQSDPYLVGPGGDPIIITEVKSKARHEGLENEDIPDFAHTVQLNTYLSATGVDQGFFIYIESGDYEIEIVPFEQDESLWEYTKLLHTIYHDYRVDDELPPRLPVRPNECQWCQYRPLCERNDDGREYRVE